MKGTPYVYQGEEIGMTNIEFESINDYKDVETKNAYNELLENGFSKEKIMSSIYENGRDNARTPLHWNSEKYSGFSTIEPWIPVNPNYKSINIESQIDDQESILQYYRKLIDFRRNSSFSECIIYGRFELLLPDDDKVFSYIRSDDKYKLLILCNYSQDVIEPNIPLEYSSGDILLSNYNFDNHNLKELQPFEALVIKLDN